MIRTCYVVICVVIVTATLGNAVDFLDFNDFDSGSLQFLGKKIESSRLKRQTNNAYDYNPTVVDSPSKNTAQNQEYNRPTNQEYSRSSNAYQVNPPQQSAYPVNLPSTGSSHSVDAPKLAYGEIVDPPRTYSVNPPQRAYGDIVTPPKTNPVDEPKPAYGEIVDPPRTYSVNPPQRAYGDIVTPPKTNPVDEPKLAYGEIVDPPRTYSVNPPERAYGDIVTPPKTYPVDEPKLAYGEIVDPPQTYSVDPPKRAYGDIVTPPKTYPVNVPVRQMAATNPMPTDTVKPLARPSINIPNEVPFLLIKKDNSMYASGSVPGILNPEEDSTCEKSETRVKDKHVCKGKLLFHEDFDILNPKIWKSDIGIPKKPDYEFVSFIQSKNNSYIADGKLVLKPTLLSELKNDIVRHGKLKLDDCALVADSGSCFKEAEKYNILPPILGARIRTQSSFNFLYGRIDIKAKMPSGDWIYPEMWLEPEESSYGRWYQSGRIVVGMVRGNTILAGPSDESMGVQQLNAGCLFRNSPKLEVNYDKYSQKINEDGWNKDFHNYSVLWTPEFMKYYVDDEFIGSCEPPNANGKQIPWKRGTNMAPFDKPFHITLGIAAAGVSEFPDRILNGAEKHPKPWKNVGAKATLMFYEDQNNWFSTWDENSVFKIDSISVYAL